MNQVEQQKSTLLIKPVWVNAHSSSYLRKSVESLHVLQWSFRYLCAHHIYRDIQARVFFSLFSRVHSIWHHIFLGKKKENQTQFDSFNQPSHPSMRRCVWLFVDRWGTKQNNTEKDKKTSYFSSIIIGEAEAITGSAGKTTDGRWIGMVIALLFVGGRSESDGPIRASSLGME